MDNQEAEDQAHVSAMEAEVTEQAANIEAPGDAGIQAGAELETAEPVAEVVDAAALENASISPEEPQPEPLSDTHGVEVRRIPDKLDEVIAKGIAAYDGYPDHAGKVEYLREAARGAVGVSQLLRDLLADAVADTLGE